MFAFAHRNPLPVVDVDGVRKERIKKASKKRRNKRINMKIQTNGFFGVAWFVANSLWGSLQRDYNQIKAAHIKLHDVR